MKTKHALRGTVFSVALFCLVLLMCLALSSCGGTELASGLNENEAQEALVTLQQYGVAAEKVRFGEGKDATWSLMVPTSQMTMAGQILEQYELPRKRPSGFSEVFSQAGLIPTAMEEKAKYLLALQGELSRTFETVDRVVSARVHIVLPENNPLAEEQSAKATASVFIKYRGENLPLTPEEIKQMVSHSVDGLEPDQVAVVLKPLIINRNELSQLAQTTTGFWQGERARMAVFVMAGVCVLLAAILVFLVLRLQKEKQRLLQVRREMSVMSSGPAGK